MIKRSQFNLMKQPNLNHHMNIFQRNKDENMQHETIENEKEEKFETKITQDNKHQVKNNDEIRINDKIENKSEKYSNFNKFDEKEDDIHSNFQIHLEIY